MTTPIENITYSQWYAAICQEMTPQPARPQEALPLEWFWVIDACAHPDIFEKVRQRDPSHDAWALYMNTFMEEAMQAGPWFMPYDLKSSFTSWLFSLMEEIPIGFLLSVQHGGGNEMYEHLQNILECTFSQSEDSQQHENKSGLFRFYDPRILYGLTTFSQSEYVNLVKGPALSLHAWEPGRSVAVTHRSTPAQKNCRTDHPHLPESLIDHLWMENQIHTILSTLSGSPGDALRAMPLPKAYKYVEDIRIRLKSSPYSNNTDVAYLTAYSLLSPDEAWKDVLEKITLVRFLDCPSLHIALEKSFAVQA